jgi:aryl-alcohol dehydrogenase-like predicted oxidoreductase
MDTFQKTILGNTGIEVGRLGLAASYGAPAAAFEESFEKGCNYFYWGSGRKKAGMTQAVINLCKKGLRDKLVFSLQTYARSGLLTEAVQMRRLKKLGLDHADILVLGWHNKIPSERLVERALKMREKGMFRYLAVSGHNRSNFPEMEKTGVYDVFHIRYNAAHRGAETECFPHFAPENRPGIVTYTATRQGYLLNPKKMPDGEAPLTATDCYRFVMGNPAVDICLCGPKNHHEMTAALSALELGPLSLEENDRVKRIGDHVHQKGGGFF